MKYDGDKLFLSYRRALSVDFAGRVHDRLAALGYDVFFDISSIPSGRFWDIIVQQIEARPLFVPILVPGCFDGADREDDFFRREIEHALAKRRHIVPLAGRRFSFADERARLRRDQLPGRLDELATFHYIDVPESYFDAAIQKLVDGLKAGPQDVVVSPAPPSARLIAQKLAEAARATHPSSTGTSRLRPLVLRWDSTTQELQWDPVLMNAGYVLEESQDESFANSTVVYEGPERRFVLTSKIDRYLNRYYYRVMAKGGFGLADSEWSNVILFAAGRGRSPKSP